MRRLALAALALALPAFAQSASSGAVPLTISQQGRLLDGSDNPVTGTVSLTFRIYDAEFSASVNPAPPLWSDTFSDVEVSQGVYAVALGSQALLPQSVFPAGANRWLGIAVNGGPEMQPRLRIGSVPYAYLAGAADMASDLDCTGCVTSAMLAPGVLSGDSLSDASITGSKIASGTITGGNLADGTIPIGKLDPAAQSLLASPFAPRLARGDAATLDGEAASDIVAAAEKAIPPAGSYIQNGSSLQSGASFNIDGSGAIGGSLTVNGNVGIGAAPNAAYPMWVAGTPNPRNGGLLLTDDAHASATTTSFGGVYIGSGPGVDFVLGKLTHSNGSSNDYNALQIRDTSGAVLLHVQPGSSGNLGIGTQSPQAKLDVAGGIRLGNDGASCGSANAGELRYAAGQLQLCDGIAWKEVGRHCNAPFLLASWPMSDGSGSLLTDCASGFDGTISNATWTSGPNGMGALAFSGNGSVTVYPADSLGYDDFPAQETVESWVKWTGGSGSGTIYQAGSCTSPYPYGYCLVFGVVAGNLNINANGPGCNVAAGSLTDGNWHSVAGIWDKLHDGGGGSGGSCMIYLDGAKVASAPWSVNSPFHAVPSVQFGNGYDSNFTGSIGPTMVYRYARSSAAICTDAGKVWTGSACQ